VRSPQEYTGERTHMPDYPEEGALRGGHIPTAVSIPWAKAAEDNGRFRSRAELDALYGHLRPEDNTIVYCRIGERSSHTWFVLTASAGAAQRPQHTTLLDRVGHTLSGAGRRRPGARIGAPPPNEHAGGARRGGR
jgi:rhodanese-related sulfurtransferase